MRWKDEKKIGEREERCECYVTHEVVVKLVEFAQCGKDPRPNTALPIVLRESVTTPIAITFKNMPVTT